MGIGAHRGALAVLGLGMAVAVVGCGPGGGAADGGPGRGGSAQGAESPSAPAPVGSSPVSRSASASPSGPVSGVGGAADGTDVSDCFDGRCRIVVTKQPTRIPVDDRFGVGSLEVTSVTARSVVLRAFGDGTFLSTSVGEGGTGGLNGLGFRVVELREGRAVLDFFPKK
ncbi:hypothetical protein [Streptomyces sp. NPDC001508]|uniref:hypothetical protein n=1 Tax=Streptomyces sp. NPDC001508 TaxID=3154656 RepID=UPI00331A3E0F